MSIESRISLASAVIKTQPIKPAATVILVRPVQDSPDNSPDKSLENRFEIFMLRRTTKAAFAGGMYVFPGGRVDPEDHFNKYADICAGPADNQRAQAKALGIDHLGYWVAGIRESFEEAGLLLAYDASGNYVEFEAGEIAARFAALREPLHNTELSLHDICVTHNLRLAVDRIHFYNRAVTPQGRPRRFDTRFFIAQAPSGQTGLHDDTETVGSQWISPTEALRQFDEGHLGLMRITQKQLSELAAYDTMESLLATARSREQFPVLRPNLPSK